MTRDLALEIRALNSLDVPLILSLNNRTIQPRISLHMIFVISCPYCAACLSNVRQSDVPLSVWKTQTCQQSSTEIIFIFLKNILSFDVKSDVLNAECFCCNINRNNTHKHAYLHHHRAHLTNIYRQKIDRVSEVAFASITCSTWYVLILYGANSLNSLEIKLFDLFYYPA